MFFVVIIKYHQNRVLLRSNEKASDPPPNTIFSNFLINQKSYSKRILKKMQDLIDFIKDIKLINQMRHKIQKKKIH